MQYKITDVTIDRKIDQPNLNTFGKPDGSGRTHSLATVKFTDSDGIRRVTLLGNRHFVGGKHWTDLSDEQIIRGIETNELKINRR